ncbi:hypothetical protein [Pelagibius sp.]|uniref:hypothetical protein n=1 Tax=Pelagibius sp. TaxID=1931238 RepID=UPI0026204FB3|nr:hypothetical protein [Pelagibius sp.]
MGMMLRGLVPGASTAIVGLACAMLLAGCAAPKPVDEFESRHEYFEVEGWHTGAVFFEADGAFSSCFISSDYLNGISLEIARHEHGYHINLFKFEWSLEAGKSYPVRLQIDDLWQRDFEITAVTEKGILIFLGFDAEALRALRQGSLLTVFAETETFRFKLYQGRAALDRLERCLRENLPQAVTDYRNPFAAEQNPFKARPRSASGVKPSSLKKILKGATGVDFDVDQASEFTPDVELVYFLDEALYGLFWQNSGQGNSADDVLAITLAYMQTDCSGRAVSGQNPARDGDIGRVRQGFVACDTDDLFADVLVIESDSVNSVFVTSSSMGDAELAQEVGSAVGRFFVP